jgi:sugar/nucleoside kinase (ribokinase family)
MADTIIQTCDQEGVRILSLSSMTLDIMFEQGPSAAEILLEDLKAAKKAGCSVSYDLNYPKKLCPPADAKKIQEPMMAGVDILITTEEDTNVGFGFKDKDYEAVAERLAHIYEFKIVGITLREYLSVWRNNGTAIVYQDGRIFRDRKYEVEIVERVWGVEILLQQDFSMDGLRRGMAKKASGMEMPLPYSSTPSPEASTGPPGRGWRPC